MRLQGLVNRRYPLGPAARVLLVRPGRGVVLGVELEGAGAHPVDAPVRLAEAADVDRPQVHRRFAAHDPLGERLAGPAAGGDAVGVEAGADVEVCNLGRLAKDEVAVGGEGFGAVEHILDPGPLERRHARERLLHERLEVVPVVVQQRIVEALGDAVLGPGDRIRLVAAHDQATHLLLEVDQPVRVAQSRQVARHPLDRLGHDVLVLDRNQRHVDAGQRCDLARPLPGAVDHHLAGDRALGGHDAAGPPALDRDAGDRAVLDDGGAAPARALGQREGDVGGIGLAVGRQEGGADHVGHLHQRPQLARLLGRQQFHLEAEAARRGGLALDLGPALLVARQAQAPVHLPARGLAGLFLKFVIEFDAVLEELRDIGIGPQLADQAGRVEGRAAGQLGALQEHHVAPAEPCQVIGGRAADDAAADDDRARLGRMPRHGHLTPP